MVFKNTVKSRISTNILLVAALAGVSFTVYKLGVVVNTLSSTVASQNVALATILSDMKAQGLEYGISPTRLLDETRRLCSEPIVGFAGTALWNKSCGADLVNKLDVAAASYRQASVAEADATLRPAVYTPGTMESGRDQTPERRYIAANAVKPDAPQPRLEILSETVPGAASAELRGIYTGNTTARMSVSTEISAANDPPGAGAGPRAGIFSFVKNTGSAADGVGILADCDVAVSGKTCFGGNVIARSEAVSNAKLVGFEIDQEFAVGSTPSPHSIGLALNVYSVPRGGPAVQLGALGGGTWTNGVLVGHVDQGGTGLGVVSGSPRMASLVNTTNDGGGYGQAAIVIGPNDGRNNQRILLSGTGGGSASISESDKNRLNISSSGDVEIKGGNVSIAAGAVRIDGALSIGTQTLLSTVVALANGAGNKTAALTNAPAAGNPTKWIPINDNGTTRYIPAW